MTRVPSELNALLGSRICHDLISPLGAIGNGVELLEMSGGQSTAEMALISDAVADANARIRLFRLAFGAAGPGQTVGGDEIADCVARIGANRGVAASWSPAHGTDRATARLGMLLLLCAETLMPHGGTARIDADATVTLTIETERLRSAPDLLALLCTPDDTLPQASAIHFVLARIAAEEMTRQIVVEETPTGLSITA